MEAAAGEERETDSHRANQKAEGSEQQAAESTVADAFEEGLGALVDLQRAVSFVPAHREKYVEA